MTILKMVRLGDIAPQNLRNGLSPSTTGEVSAKVLTLSAVTGDQFNGTAIKTSTFLAKPPADQSVSENDLLICRGNGNPNLVGRGFFAKSDMPDVTFPDTIIAARVDRTRVHKPFLEHAWNSPGVRSQIRSIARTTNGTYKVNQQTLSDVEIPLPSLPEQRRIAAILDQAVGLRAQRRATLALLDELVQSIFIEMFGDPLANQDRLPTCLLGELSRVVRGASPRPKGDPRYFGGNIPWPMISDVTRASGMTVSSIREGVTPAGRDKSVFMKAGTLLLTNSATVGMPKFLGIDACIHDGFLAFLELSDSLSPTFLYWLLLMRRKQIVSLAPEGTQKNLNTGIVKDLEITVPTREAQESFLCRVTAVQNIQKSTLGALSEQDNLLASLQHRAFRGEL